MGSSSTSRQQQQREAKAHHEAGHAVADLELGFRVSRVTIVAADDSLGRCEGGSKVPSWLEPDVTVDMRTRSWIERRVMGILAGPIAEERFTGRPNHDGAAGDWRQAVTLADFVCGSADEVAAFLAWLKIRTANFLASCERWPMVEAVARALLERGTLTGHGVKTVARKARMDLLPPMPRLRAVQVNGAFRKVTAEEPVVEAEPAKPRKRKKGE
jgi:hypothetical protein